MRHAAFTILAGTSFLAFGCFGDAKLSGRSNRNGSDVPHPPSDSYDPSFQCNPNATGVAPTPIQRMAKVQLLGALREFFSALSSSDRAALIATAQSQIDLLPDDSSVYSYRGDGLVTQNHADAAFNLAFALASQVAANNGYANSLARVCGAGSTRASLAIASCLSTFVNYYGRKAFRRPLSSEELNDFASFYNSLGSDGLAGLLARLLSHPRFYYALDSEGTQLSGTEGADATYALTNYELASKLTFLFWEAPPDDPLYTFVAAADLTQGGDLERLLTRILSDSRAKQGVSSFIKQWLRLDRVPNLPSMDTPAFEAFAAGQNVGAAGHHHREDMIQEILDLGAYYTLTVQGRYEDLLTSRYSFATTADLAAIYGVAPWNGMATQMVSFPPGGRSGLLTRAALLVSGSEGTRPIQKGKEVRFQLLCDELPPPPPALQITPLRPDAQKTNRQIVEAATASATCQVCHSKMNPLGFATEGFDPLGRARASEQKFSADGTVVNSLAVQTEVVAAVYPGDETVVRDAAELSQHIAATGKGQQCLVRQYFRYTYGRLEAESSDGCDLERIRTQLTAPSGTLQEMFKELARRDAFRLRKVQ
jgi:hypothetical protein